MPPVGPDHPPVHQVMLLYDVTSDRSFCAVRHWVNSIDVRVIIPIMSVGTWCAFCMH